MNYPVWDVGGIGSGLVVAIIAIIHVFISHLAVGGGAFLFVAELWSDKQSDGPRIRQWLHKFGTWFLVFTTVAGATTGVGIWFAIQLANPEATSLLIHQFVFAWATEWVLFLAELTVLYLYYYGWDTNSRSMQRLLAGAYFFIAWGSLVVINGILSFMLTPGSWTLENHDILAGFFNPGYFPSLILRTMMMFLLAGLGGIFIGSKIDSDLDFKERIIRFSAKWVIPAALLVPPAFVWYWSTLPEGAMELTRAGMVGASGGTLTTLTRMGLLAGSAALVLVVGSLVIAAAPRVVSPIAAVSLMLVALMGIMGAEFYREMARKPYVVHGVLYSNSLWKHDATAENCSHSYMKHARWAEDTDASTTAHGEQIFRLQCASCHTRDGYRSVAWRTRQWTPLFGFKWFSTMADLGVMPPFYGDANDRAALVSYLMTLQGKSVTPQSVIDEARKAGVDIDLSNCPSSPKSNKGVQ